MGGLLYGRLGSAALFRTAALVLAAGWLATCAVLRKWGGREGSGHGGAGDGARRQQEEAAGVAYRLVVQASSEGDAEDAALLLRGS